MAKQVLVESTHIRLPEWAGTRSMPSPPTGQDMHGITWAGRYVFRAGRLAGLLHAESERAIGGVRPDVLATDDEGALLLEVRVTHPVQRAKREIVQSRRYRMVEIDLSKVTFEDASDPMRFRHLVLDEPSNRYWISLPEAEDDWHAAQAELEAHLAAVDAAASLEPMTATVAPPFAPGDPLRLPEFKRPFPKPHKSALRTAPLASSLWHSGYGVGTVLRELVENSAVYVVTFEPYGERTIVLRAADEGISWKLLKPKDP